MSDHHDHGSMHGVASTTLVDPHAGHDMNHGEDVVHSQTDNGSVNHPSTDHTMQMYFRISNEATILFYSWTTSTAAGMFGSCVVIMILATLYEGLKVFRERLFYSVVKKNCCRGESQPLPTDDNHFTVVQPSAKSNSSPRSKIFNRAHFLQTLLHIIQIGISYLLMLVFMTYNVWLCLSIVAGAGLGYFLFGWMKARLVDANECCH